MSIATLKHVLDRCVEDGDCWIWAQGTGSAGYPSGYVKGRKGAVLIRRWVVEQKLSRPLASKEIVAAKCGEKKCCNPEHLKLSNHSAVMREAHRSGARPPLSIAAQRAKAEKAGFTKITAAKAAEIRARLVAGAKPVQLVDEFGLSVSAIKRIRQGVAWAVNQPGASVFSLGGLAA